jgi:anti-anti-sigma regulatory factor
LTEAVVAAGVALASGMALQSQRAAEASARVAAAAQARAEEKAAALELALDQVNTQLGQQSRLLDLVATLETPAVPLAEGVLLAPIVGHLDSRRAADLTSRLLQAAGEQRTRLLILDIAGVPVIDTGVAQALVRTAQALRLLGCDVTLSGISASVAMTLTQLGVELGEIATVRSPREALVRELAV